MSWRAQFAAAYGLTMLSSVVGGPDQQEAEILACRLSILWNVPSAGLLDEFERFVTEHDIELLPALRRAVKYAAAGDSREDIERKLVVDGKVIELCHRLAVETVWAWGDWLEVIHAASERVVEHKRTVDALTFEQCEWLCEQLRSELFELEWPRIAAMASAHGLTVAVEIIVVMLGGKHRSYPMRMPLFEDTPVFPERIPIPDAFVLRDAKPPKARRESRAHRLSRLSRW